MDATPFEIVEPAEETPVLVEVPHAGLWLDAESLAYTVAPARSIGRDADLHVDRLFERSPEVGATLLVARASRYFVDLNRGPDDFDGGAVEGGGSRPLPRGLVWRLTTEGDRILRRPLPRAELERRMNLCYRPYHEAVARITARKREVFGYAILLCAHSMPAFGRRSTAQAGPKRADLVPGSRGRTSAAGDVIDVLERVGKRRGYSVVHDDPYRGGFSTAHYGRPDEGVHAVQIEIGRSLYMDEDTLQIDEAGFPKVQAFARDVVQALLALDASRLAPRLRRHSAE